MPLFRLSPTLTSGLERTGPARLASVLGAMVAGAMSGAVLGMIFLAAGVSQSGAFAHDNA